MALLICQVSGLAAEIAEIGTLLKPGELDTILLPKTKQLMASRNDGQNAYYYLLSRRAAAHHRRVRMAPRAASHGQHKVHIFMLQEGNAHTYRQIFPMDGRPHPVNPSPTWYGHSIGRWDGDTLVVDTIGLDDRFWLDGSGIRHTEQLHMVERWTRTNLATMRNEVKPRIREPFSRPFSVCTGASRVPESEIRAYIAPITTNTGSRRALSQHPGANQLIRAEALASADTRR